jgi:hypothetical protein
MTAKSVDLQHVFEVRIPTECICGKLLPESPRQTILDEVAGRLSEWFGGYEITRIDGGYKHDDGKLAKEPVDLVTSYATDAAFEKHREEFMDGSKLRGKHRKAEIVVRKDDQRAIRRLKGQGADLNSIELRKRIAAARSTQTRGQLYDPIEDDPRYSKAIKDAEEEVNKNLTGHRGLGVCHIFWASKKKLLKDKYNIVWFTPSEMNPFTRFD